VDQEGAVVIDRQVISRNGPPKSNSSGGLQIESSKTHLQTQIKSIEFEMKCQPKWGSTQPLFLCGSRCHIESI
jgi:hypothetical protein